MALWARLKLLVNELCKVYTHVRRVTLVAQLPVEFIDLTDVVRMYLEHCICCSLVVFEDDGVHEQSGQLVQHIDFVPPDHVGRQHSLQNVDSPTIA